MRRVRWLAMLPLALLACAAAQPGVKRVAEAFKLVERLSSEGVDVSGQIAMLNRALELYAENRTGEADALVTEAARQLENLEQQLPQIRAARWASTGFTVAALAAVPPLFYYFFPRLYALAWARARKRWLVRKRGNRR